MIHVLVRKRRKLYMPMRISLQSAHLLLGVANATKCCAECMRLDRGIRCCPWLRFNFIVSEMFSNKVKYCEQMFKGPTICNLLFNFSFYWITANNDFPSELKTSLLNFIDPTPSKTTLLLLVDQPRWHVFQWMCTREFQWWFWPLEWMRLLQFSLQKLFIDFLLISVAIQIQIECCTEWKVFFVSEVWLRKIIFENRFFHVQQVVKHILHTWIPIGLEKCQSSRCNIILVLAIKVHRFESARLQIVAANKKLYVVSFMWIRICLCTVMLPLLNFQFIEIQFLLLFVEDEYMAMVTSASGWERLQIWCNQLALRYVAIRNIPTGIERGKYHSSDCRQKEIHIRAWTHMNQCTYSLSLSWRCPSGFVSTNVHKVSFSSWIENSQFKK